MVGLYTSQRLMFVRRVFAGEEHGSAFGDAWQHRGCGENGAHNQDGVIVHGMCVTNSGSVTAAQKFDFANTASGTICAHCQSQLEATK